MVAIQTDASCIRRRWRLSATIHRALRLRTFPRGITSFPGRSFEHYPDKADRKSAVHLKADRAFPSPGRRAKPASGSVVQGSAVTLIAAHSICGMRFTGAVALHSQGLPLRRSAHESVVVWA